jgi:ferredoxin
MQREIIHIDEDKCTGCGLCVPGCPEGALQIIDGKARLISDRFCDGLGACIGECPEGAITVEKREAEPYDERKVMENIIKQGPNVIKAHLAHLREHNETDLLKQSVEVLKEKKIVVEESINHPSSHFGGCPGSAHRQFSQSDQKDSESVSSGEISSVLTHWPVQLHLISPMAPVFQKADVLLAADCSAFSFGDFHRKFLKGKALIIACPKLDEGQDIYLAKLKVLMDDAKMNTLTVLTMEVPCCRGLLSLAQKASEETTHRVPIKSIVISIQGKILKEEWVSS